MQTSSAPRCSLILTTPRSTHIRPAFCTCRPHKLLYTTPPKAIHMVEDILFISSSTYIYIYIYIYILMIFVHSAGFGFFWFHVGMQHLLAYTYLYVCLYAFMYVFMYDLCKHNLYGYVPQYVCVCLYPRTQCHACSQRFLIRFSYLLDRSFSLARTYKVIYIFRLVFLYTCMCVYTHTHVYYFLFIRTCV